MNERIAESNTHEQVYVLSTWEDHASGFILGVFDSLDGAMEAAGSDRSKWKHYPADGTPQRERDSWERGTWSGEAIELFEVQTTRVLDG